MHAARSRLYGRSRCTGGRADGRAGGRAGTYARACDVQLPPADEAVQLYAAAACRTAAHACRPLRPRRALRVRAR